MATENFSLTLPDNFVRREPRKSVDGLSATDDTEVSHSPEGSLTSGTGVYCVRLHRCHYDDSAVSKYEIHQAENLDYNRETLSQIFLPGSGMAARLLAVCREEGRLQAIILSKFCEEGDNTRDGLELADYSNQVLEIGRASCRERV